MVVKGKVVRETIRWAGFPPDALERPKPCRLRHGLGPVAPDGAHPPLAPTAS